MANRQGSTLANLEFLTVALRIDSSLFFGGSPEERILRDPRVCGLTAAELSFLRQNGTLDRDDGGSHRTVSKIPLSSGPLCRSRLHANAPVCSTAGVTDSDRHMPFRSLPGLPNTFTAYLSFASTFSFPFWTCPT